MTRILTITLCAISISVPAFAHSAQGEAKVGTTRPVGNGNPSSISCYLKDGTFSRIARKVCKTNAEWARIQINMNKGSW
jgi:hypothetical protein